MSKVYRSDCGSVWGDWTLKVIFISVNPAVIGLGLPLVGPMPEGGPSVMPPSVDPTSGEPAASPPEPAEPPVPPVLPPVPALLPPVPALLPPLPALLPPLPALLPPVPAVLPPVPALLPPVLPPRPPALVVPPVPPFPPDPPVPEPSEEPDEQAANRRTAAANRGVMCVYIGDGFVQISLMNRPARGTRRLPGLGSDPFGSHPFGSQKG
jgi:hypothetical protein